MESDVSIFIVLGSILVVSFFGNPGRQNILESKYLTWLVVIKLNLVYDADFPATHAPVLLAGNDGTIDPVD